MSLARATLVQRIRRELGDFPWEDTSCSAASATSTITGATAGSWVRGDIGEFVTDGDTFLTISESGGTITATRSYDGSTGATHTTERVLKNPRYRYLEIVNAIESVIQDRLWPWAWKKVADTITPDPSSTTWYDLAADAVGLISVRQLHGTNNTKEGRYGGRRDKRVWMQRNMTTTLCNSGTGLRFPDGFWHPTNTVNVDYAARITDTVGAGAYSDITDGDGVVEAIIYGAVSHLEAALENRKPRRPREDRETLRGAALYERKFQDALHRSKMQLSATIPMIPADRIRVP